MLRMGLGSVLLGLAFATQAAQFDEAFLEPKLNFLSTQIAHSDADFMLHYQLSAGVVLTRLPDTPPIGPELGGIFQPSPAAKPQQETTRTINTRWQQDYGGDRVSLSRLLRLEFKGESANIALLPRSILIEGKQLKVTFRPQSALIERDRLKIMLKPHAATMLWNKAF